MMVFTTGSLMFSKAQSASIFVANEISFVILGAEHRNIFRNINKSIS
jgi:hypothetical protein